MLRFSRQQLLRASGQHLASTPHVRLQVLAITQTSAAPPFARDHGEVLLVVLAGSCNLVLDKDQHPMVPGDQALVEDGEAFMLFSKNADAIVQFVWLPGPNPCKPCGLRTQKSFSGS
jgi:hypothetical protein